MKKLTAFILSISIIVSCTAIAVYKGLFDMPKDRITYKQVHQFADKLKELEAEADYRLIVIDYLKYF